MTKMTAILAVAAAMALTSAAPVHGAVSGSVAFQARPVPPPPPVIIIVPPPPPPPPPPPRIVLPPPPPRIDWDQRRFPPAPRFEPIPARPIQR